MMAGALLGTTTPGAYIESAAGIEAGGRSGLTAVVIVLMSFTYNLAIGMTAGFVLYPLMKVMGGRHREVPPGMWILGALSLGFFVFYPY